jgi:hypothetical protein
MKMEYEHEKEQTKWATKHTWREYTGDSNFFGKSKYYYATLPSKLKMVSKLGLSIAGGTLMYELGLGVGALIEQIPAVAEYISSGIEYISGLEVKGNITGVSGLAGAIYGVLDSGIKLDENLDFDKIRITPISINKN